MNKTLKKLPGPQHLIDPLTVIATPGQFMCATRMPHIFHRTTKNFKAFIEHFTLHKTSSPVVVPMENDIGCIDVLHIINRGFPGQCCFGHCFQG